MLNSDVETRFHFGYSDFFTNTSSTQTCSMHYFRKTTIHKGAVGLRSDLYLNFTALLIPFSLHSRCQFHCISWFRLQSIGKAKIQQFQRQKYYCQDSIGYKFIHKYCRLSKIIYLCTQGNKTCAGWAFGRAQIPASDALTQEVIPARFLGVEVQQSHHLWLLFSSLGLRCLIFLRL